MYIISIIIIYQRGRCFIYTQILSQYQRINKQIQNIEHQQKEFPDGNLVCTQNGKYYKWYKNIENNYNYIPKKEKFLANKLAYKKYLSSQLKDLKQEKIAIEHYLKKHSNNSYVDQMLNHPEFQALLKPYFTPLSKVAPMASFLSSLFSHFLHFSIVF